MFVSFWRTFVLFLAVTVALRFMGKRQIGELQPSELATTIMISNIAAIPIENSGSPMINGLLAIAMIACMEVLISAAILKFPALRALSLGHTRCIIRDGKVIEAELRNLRWSLDDLMKMLRINGIFDIDEVLFAFVETNGSLSAYPKFEHREVTNSSLDIPVPEQQAPPVLLISDGKVDKNALGYCGLSEKWLYDVLKKEKLLPDDVFLMSCDRSRNYRLIKKERCK